MKTLREPAVWRVDVTGLHCPAPVIRCRAVLARMQTGDVLTLRATDPDAQREISVLVERGGHQMLALHARTGGLEFVIRKVAMKRGTGARISVASGWQAVWERMAGYLPAPV